MDRQRGGSLEFRRPPTQLLVDKQGRKPLFATANPSNAAGRDNDSQQSRPPGSGRYRPPVDGLVNRARPDYPTPPSAQRNGHQSHTPADPQLPQGKGSSASQRRPLTMSEAYRLAQEEEEEEASGGDDAVPMDGSPSPAPRTWRSRFNDQMKATEAGRELAKVTRGEGQGDIDARSGDRYAEGQYDFEDEDIAIPPLVPGIEDSPFPSPSPGIREGLGSPLRRHSAVESPQKSFGWDIEQDFTAGDLQISDSPRIRVNDRPFANRRAFDDNSDIDLHSPTRLNPPGSRNTKLDEIRQLERRAGDAHGLEMASPRKNTKLNEIAAREASAQSQIPIPDRKLSTPRNSKLAEIQQRELEGLSKRQLASIRLGEIREQNSMARSMSDPAKLQTDVDSPLASIAGSKAGLENQSRPKSAYEATRETGKNPLTSYQSRLKEGREASRSLEDRDWRASASPARPGKVHSRNGSTDALRQIGRTKGDNPGLSTAAQRRTGSSTTTSGKTSDSSETRSRFGKRAARNARKENKDGNGDSKKLTVGFAGLKRVQSTESTNSKRSSLHSEPDPTERLEAELKLFAPTDNYSEPGSVRAQSPVSQPDDEKLEEATPRPKRQDPLMMPTPKVTGAYVETPATVRIEKMTPEDIKSEAASEDALEMPPARAKLGERKRSSSWSTADRNAASDPGAREGQAAKDEVGARKPRSRSLPQRRPPIRNSARLPSVKDDLLELHRLHNVEDSTLDDLEEILTAPKAAEEKVDEFLQESEKVEPLEEVSALEDEKRVAKVDSEVQPQSQAAPNAIKKEDPDAENLAAYDRMSKSLHTVSLGIRDAKKGIESLEDRFTSSQSEKGSAMTPETLPRDRYHGPAYTERADASALAYVQIPVPRLYHRQPTFRFTLFGLLALIASLWYLTESVMCANFCRPTTCDPTTGPCIWSFDDPTSFGTALPIKVDQWITGGYGRKRFGEVYEMFDDARADLVDAALGRHIADVDIDALLTPDKRRQHRRRLRNKGLLRRKNVDATPEERAKWAAWHTARLASEKAQEAREMGYAWDEERESSVGGDVPMY